MLSRELELGAIQTHVLYHATHQAIYGSWMAEELARHGFSISFGTLYPMLHRMREEGLLVCEERREGSQARKYYSATEQGRHELERARRLIRELYREVVAEAEEHPAQVETEAGDESERQSAT